MAQHLTGSHGESLEAAANEIFMSGVAVSSSRPGFVRGMSLIVSLDMVIANSARLLNQS